MRYIVKCDNDGCATKIKLKRPPSGPVWCNMHSLYARPAPEDRNFVQRPKTVKKDPVHAVYRAFRENGKSMRSFGRR